MFRTTARALLLPLALALCGCSMVADWGPPPGFAIQRGDVIAIGRLENLHSEPPDFASDDLLGHGWFSGKLHVSRIEFGDLPERVVPVRYFAHTFLSEDVSFRFRLRPDESGNYLICKRLGSAGYDCDGPRIF